MLDKFLVDSTGGDEEMIAFLQRSAGYTLSGFTDEEKFFLVHGPEASGKSTFLEMLKAVLGDYAQTADFETFVARNQVGGARNDIARLAGARFVASIEVDEGKRLAEGLVKTITGGDSICARFLYREAFEFRPQFKLWLACNHAPRISEGDGGMWRRILRVPFEHTVPESERDPKVKATLKNVDEAGPAILAWAVEGCLRWQMEGLNVPDGVTAATAQYRQEQDPLAEFLDDMCNVGDEDLFVPVTDLRKSYERWASDVGVKHTLGAKAFNERLESRGCRRVTRRYYNDLGTAKIGKCWVGITLVCNRFPSTLSDENDDSLPI
jgi:putative DNA primase/helicase